MPPTAQHHTMLAQTRASAASTLRTRAATRTRSPRKRAAVTTCPPMVRCWGGSKGPVLVSFTSKRSDGVSASHNSKRYIHASSVAVFSSNTDTYEQLHVAWLPPCQPLAHQLVQWAPLSCADCDSIVLIPSVFTAAQSGNWSFDRRCPRRVAVTMKAASSALASGARMQTMTLPRCTPYSTRLTRATATRTDFTSSSSCTRAVMPRGIPRAVAWHPH